MSHVFSNFSGKISFAHENVFLWIPFRTPTLLFLMLLLLLSLVLQLVKSQKEHIKLILETEKEKILRKEFVFESTKVTDTWEGPHPFENELTEQILQELELKCAMFCFMSWQKREGFCQLLQQMKNKHSQKPEPDMITVFVGTWNMGNQAERTSTSWTQQNGLTNYQWPRRKCRSSAQH